MKIEIRKSIVGMHVACAECGNTVDVCKTGAQVRAAVAMHKCPEVTVYDGINRDVYDSISPTITVNVERRGRVTLTEIQARQAVVALVAALDARARLREEHQMREALDCPLDDDEQGEADAQQEESDRYSEPR